MKNFENTEYQNFLFDGEEYDKNLDKSLQQADHILVSIPPINSSDIVIKKFNNKLNHSNKKWITYLSATSVYGNHNGKWVDENSITNPTSINGVNRLKAEQSWLSLFQKFKSPIQIFRLSGIYSNQFNILNRLKRGEAKIIKKQNHFFSRIHVEDIANLLFHSMKKFKSNEIYNVSDDKPASQEEIASYGSKLLKIKSPEFLELDTLEDGMLKDFYKDSKKVDNKKVKEFFNYKLIYPTYKEGLDKILNDMV
jgi:nucleoside-diphosphate-sugar epimerase